MRVNESSLTLFLVSMLVGSYGVGITSSEILVMRLITGFIILGSLFGILNAPSFLLEAIGVSAAGFTTGYFFVRTCKWINVRT